MFGYVIARGDTLSPEETARYRGCYCGLCHALRTGYGQFSRLALNYDMTFLILLLSSLYEPEETEGRARCAAHPAKAQDFWTNEFSDYAAHLTALLTWQKLRDDWLDEGTRLKKSLMDRFQGAYDRAKAALPRQCEIIERELEALLELEKAGCGVPDQGAACFGRLMAGMFAPRQDRWTDTLEETGFFLGEFIYLQDACLDLQKDARKNRYNPLLAMSGEARPLAEYEPTLLMLAGRCAAAFDRLPLVQDAGLLRNILYEGMWTRYHEGRARQERLKKEPEGEGQDKEG